jgi:hypothetical protein
MSNTLKAGEELLAGGVLHSDDQRVRLVMQTDGNLVLYRASGGGALWASNTMGTGANRAVMQEDGNFVLYNPTSSVWATNTHGQPGNRFVVQDDGNLVIYDEADQARWAANVSFFPLQASTRWRRSAMAMDATARLTRSGQLQADIHTEVTWIAKGFTGGCLVMVADRDDTVIHDWLIWPLGVDAKVVFLKPNRRDDHRRQQVPADVLARADHLVVACSHIPKDRFLDILGEIRDKAKAVKDTIEDILG